MKSVWGWLNGKKRTIAEVYWGFAIPAVTLWFDGQPPFEVARIIALVGLALTYIGLGHATVKKVVGG